MGAPLFTPLRVMADGERLLGVRAAAPTPVSWPEGPPVPAPDGQGTASQAGPEPWPPHTQWAVAVTLAAALVLLGWRGWGMSRWSARPAPIERNAFPVAIDLNAAAEADLQLIPGLGPGLAARVVEHRQANGPFRSVEELEQVRGIGPATLARVRPYLWVAPANEAHLPPRVVRGAAPERGAPALAKKKPPDEPVDINRATAEELQKLPGIGPTLSARILQERKQRPFASVDDLRRVKGIGGGKTLDRLRPHLRVGAGGQ